MLITTGITLAQPASIFGAVGDSGTDVMDFLTGTLDPRLSFTRSTPRLYRDGNGDWQQAAAHTPRLHHDAYGAALGTLFEKGHADKCLLGTNPAGLGGSWYATPAELTIGSDGSVLSGLAALGFAGLFSSYYRIDNSAGGTETSLQIRNSTGNTNTHSLQCIAKQAGTGDACNIRISSGSPVAMTQDDAWEYLTLENQLPVSASKVTTVSVPAGRIFYLALACLDETAWIRTPVLHPLDNTTVNPGPDTATAALSAFSKWSTASCVIALEWYHDKPFTSATDVIFSLTDSTSDLSNYLTVAGTAAGDIQIIMKNGGSTVWSDSLTPSTGAINRLVLRLKPNGFLAAMNGTTGTPDISGSPPIGLNTMGINKYRGSSGNAIFRRIEMTDSDLNDTAIQAASVVGSGVLA